MYPDFYTDTGKFYILSRGPSIFLWKKPLPFKFLASALIVVQSCLPDMYMSIFTEPRGKAFPLNIKKLF